MLRELVASGGMKSQGGGSGLMSFGPPPDLQYREKWPAPVITEPDGWAHSHFLSEQYKQWVGCMGACWFAMNNMAPDGLLSMVDALSAITGWDLTLDEALLQGHRAAILQSLFGNQHGWQAKDDWEQVGERFLEPVPDGKHKGLGIGKWLPDIVQEYYRDSGRHEITGRPYRHTLEALGMGEFNEWAQP
jgi:aldehyde:ferredoxin oxidoreductase